MNPSVTLLGTGGPRPDIARGATSLLIEAGDDAILIDAGRGVVRQLDRARYAAGPDQSGADHPPPLRSHRRTGTTSSCRPG